MIIEILSIGERRNGDPEIEDDELVEVAPKSIRLRKVLLEPNDGKRAERATASGCGFRGAQNKSSMRLPSSDRRH